MKVNQSFVIDQTAEKLWEFFEQIDEVARCVPGVASVEVVDAENSRVRVTQALGPMTATFDLKMRITERDPVEMIQFTAVGRAVKGAAGNIRSQNTVRLEPAPDGTRVMLDADLAMGGVLGSVGQKVIAKQADEVTRQFVASLERALRGEAPAEEASPGGAAASAPAVDPAPAAPLAADPAPSRPLAKLAIAATVLAALALVVAWARRS